MSGAIPGHGYRATWMSRPACKCGWTGRFWGPGLHDDVEKAAVSEYERHKTRVRKETGYEPKAHAPAEPPKRHLELVR
jgi:hypothetical protein